MQSYVKVMRGHYVDSLETLFKTTVLMEQPGVDTGYVCMGSPNNKDIIRDMGLICPEIEAAGENDLVVVACAADAAAFAAALVAAEKSSTTAGNHRASYPTLGSAVGANPTANVCVLSVPGEHVKREAMTALDAGLHLIIFSAHVPLEDEREIKEYARGKGLLCMGPDCGVVNLNGKAFVLGSITGAGPVGICGASGIGVQYVGAMLHKAGSGVSQIIGTGGNDTKDAIGGITTLQGIDALEADPSTEYIVLVSRKPGPDTFERIMRRVEACKKPVVAYYMGTRPEEVTRHGAIWAGNLEEAAQKALELVGKTVPFDDEAELCRLADEAVQGMAPGQKYVRGAFLGGTYCDEAIRTLTDLVGGIHSNAPISPGLRLADVNVSVENTVIDYGEEEFTQGRPHPTIEPSVRHPAILHEAEDPNTAVLLLDFVLTPAGPRDPVAPVIAEIKKAQALVAKRGGRLAVVASVCGTNADIQNLDAQEQALRDAGVYVCVSNHKAAFLAAQIVKRRMEA